MSRSGRLENKVILVTGSTSGIGEGIARRFAQEGASVMAHGPELAEAQRIAGEIEADGGTAGFVSGELSRGDVQEGMIATVIERFGRIDGLVNNAGVSPRSNLETTDAALFDRIMAINLRSPLLLIRAALPYFRKQGGGRVLNIGSVNAYCGEPNLLAYSISKGGLMTMTRNLADAYGAEGIRIYQFNVGWTLTANEAAVKREAGFPENWPARLPQVYAPAGRLIAPEEIAAAAIFFLSDEAALVNGSVLDFEQYPMIGRNPPKDLTVFMK
ncbi:MAG: short-chain dehydrogenase [Chthoniobacteraceae bacterium]|nr:short-chain dehydrogenase [Chthoniobacteraceae bacterium]